jgi:hypothetical protein
MMLGAGFEIVALAGHQRTPNPLGSELGNGRCGSVAFRSSRHGLREGCSGVEFCPAKQ